MPAVDETARRSPGRGRRYAAGLVLLAGLAAGYGPVVRELVRDWGRDPNYHHGFLIPMISGYLVWSRRKMLRSVSRRPSWIGFALVISAAALLVIGSAGAEVFTQRVSLLLAVAGLVVFVFGQHHLRQLAFPIAFLLLAIPLPYVLYYGLTAPLQSLAAKFAVGGMRVMGVQAIAQGNIIHLPQTTLEVAEACSGIRSLFAFLALGALLARTAPIPALGKLAVFAASIPLSVAGNAARVWTTGLGVYMFGPSLAEGTVHEMFGVLIFVISLVAFLVVRYLARRLWSAAQSPSRSSSVWRDSTPPGSTPFDRQAKIPRR